MVISATGSEGKRAFLFLQTRARSPDSQQQQSCERSCQQAEDAYLQLKQSRVPPSLLLPSLLPT